METTMALLKVIMEMAVGTEKGMEEEMVVEKGTAVERVMANINF